MSAAPRIAPADVDRAFLRLPGGRLHYRFVDGPAAGDAPPLFMAHAGPGCSRGLEPMISALGAGRRVVAWDMPGNGDSDPPDAAAPDIAWYAERALAVIDALGLERVDVYGDHTGAQIGVELALARPDRVRRLVLDGTPLFPPELKADLQANYAPPLALDEYGGHLAWVWGFVRDLPLHFPYYRTDPDHRLTFAAIPPKEARHALAVDILKASASFHLAYRAAFAHDTAARLPLLRTPTLLLAAHGDPLAVHLDAAAALVPGGRARRVAREEKAQAVAAFLDAPP